MITTENYIKKLGIGTVQFGLDYGISNTKGKVKANEVEQILRLAKMRSISFLDTARAYGDSETVLGECMTNDFDTSFKVISKLSPAAQDIHQEIQISLNNLQTGRIYGYLFHNFETFKENPSLWKQLEKIKTENKVEKIGFSLYYPAELEILFEKNIDFDILQIPYNLFDRRFEPYFQELKTRNIEIHIRSVFLQGLFFMDNKKLSSHFVPAFEKLYHLHTLAEKHQLQKATLPLFFVLNNPDIDITLLGLSGVSNLQQNLSVVEEFEKVFSLHLDFSIFEEQNENIILPFLWKK